MARFGRYAVSAVSPYGSAVQLVDRMAGPGAEDGQAGKRDGRIDQFLGPGDHKVVLTSPQKVEAPAELQVKPFEEMNGATPPRLVELDTLSTQLGDIQQRSYWLEVTARRQVFLEAAGRHLADLRLWKDGTWLVDAAPVAEMVEPVPGRPLALRRLVADLNPGLYLVVAYGGPGTVWSDGSADTPMHLRWGIPSLPEAARRQMIAGPFGLDRWLVPKQVNYFRLELPEPGAAALDVVRYTDGQPQPGDHVVLDKTLREPVAEVRITDTAARHLVTVERAPGSSYVLQHHPSSRSYSFNGSGDYLVTALRPGSGEDDADLGAILTELGGDGSEKVVASSALRIRSDSAWKRRFNLLDTVTLFLDIAEPGRYGVTGGGVEAEIAVTPYVRSPDMKVRGPSVGGGVWTLERGLHVVTLTPRPEQRGILELTVKGDKGTQASEMAPPVTGASFAPVRMDGAKTYRLTLNQSLHQGNGALIRKLPLDMGGEVPLTLGAGETVTLPLSIPKGGLLEAVGEDERRLMVALPGAEAADRLEVTAGLHSVAFSNPTRAPVRASLRLTVPQAEAPPSVLPPVTAGMLAKVPVFPVLEAGKPRFLDLAARQSATFTVQVDRPALYRVETTGLLETEGNLRTQVLPSLASAASNGIGRNFLLQRYLREGRYQLTIAPKGSTAGHLGVSLASTPLRLGGDLTSGVPARASLDAGEALQYEVEVTEPGRYRLQVMTLGARPLIRLEDSEGWPLTTPEQTGDLERNLAAGRYRVVVLPQALPSRVVSLFQPVSEKQALAGHGPHVLPLGGSAANRWEEPAQGGERIDDLWTFTLPAAADLRLVLSDFMEAELERADGGAVAAFDHRRPFAGPLAAGDYRLKVRTIRPNNRVDYTVASEIRQLTEGRQVVVHAPAVIPISIGREQMVELSSFGDKDVRAVLRDVRGREIGRSDDRPDDWNFNIANRLSPGFYVLAVEPVGTDTAETTVRLDGLAEVEEPPMTASGQRDLVGGAVHILPLDPGPASSLLVAQAQSRDSAGLMLERRDANGDWRSVGSASGRRAVLALPHGGEAKESYRLRVWSLDHASRPITVSVHSVSLPASSEQALADGLTLARIPGLDPPVAAAEIHLDRPGLFRFRQRIPGLTWASVSDHHALRGGAEVVMAGSPRLWLVGETGAGLTVTARRITPDASVPLALTLDDGETAVWPLDDKAAAPLLLLAQSRVGQPGVALGPIEAMGDARTGGAGDGVAVAVLTDPAAVKGAMVRLWRADGEGTALPLLLRQVSFAAMTRDRLDWGLGDGQVAGGAGRDYALPVGRKRLELALPPQVVAVLMENGQAARTLWSAEQGLSVTVDSSADRLLLLNTGGEVGLYGVQISQAGTVDDRLKPGGLVKRWLPSAGSLRLELEIPPALRGKGLVVQVSGQADGARLIQKDGVVRTGTRLAVDDDAVLEVRYRPGSLAVWLDGSGEEAWPRAAESVAAPSVPGTVALAGDEASWRFDNASPTLLHLRSSEPVVTGLRRPGAAPVVAASPEAAGLHVFMPEGASVVGLRSLHGGPLAGSVRLARSEPVSLGEGLGPRLRLAPGDARLFSFDVVQAGPVGIGIKGSSDSARATLLDPKGGVLAEGNVAMKELAAGRYFLMVANRVDALPVEIQPALVGLARPDNGPPEDVKRAYWALVATEEEGSKP
ncbi:hypothetical protein CCC_01498 [Paramagnetospirillum magnetotacticum MS-1]|uniref:Uncharacterized protein n=1 Tax=Paramagnetospirillum magnetotacticum MS-1 TaxID=272627 RepID=A0A0C2UFP4_PARME|nr:hypothetical protein CCC_01498 [Paramagnetospirillum magnetotacticum MS-1]